MQPLSNLEYLSEIFVKLRKTRGTIITIHYILAFTCLFCGHGPMTGLQLPNGETRRLGFLNMHECARECCGRFLDRRFLQYTGGNCECGVLVMSHLGIRPATDNENGWRRDLFIGKGGGVAGGTSGVTHG